jgi:hypothetical protein
MALAGAGPGKWFPAKLTLAPRSPDRYQISVTSVEPGQFGRFQLDIQPLHAVLTRREALQASDPFDRQPSFQYCRTYRQELKKGAPYVVEMTSTAFSPSLRVEDPRGNEWRQASSSPGSVARVVFFPERDGAYDIVASSTLARQTGPFALTVLSPQPVVSEAAQLTTDDFFDPLQNQNYQKVHAVKLKAGEHYLISLQTREFTPFLRIESARGQHLKKAPDMVRPGEVHITLVAPRDDTYRIIVTSGNTGGTGAYRLLVRH